MQPPSIYRGQNEKYLLSSNGSNAANGGYYILMPTGDIYAWNGISIQSTILQTPINPLSADPAVYNNPLFSRAHTGAPLVSGTNPLYNLKVEFGLTSPAVGFNLRGANEWYLHSSNGSNAANGGYYMLLPNDTLVAWNGTAYANGNLVADLSADGNVYANPSLLTSATLPTSVGVTASVSGGLLTLTPAAGFDRSMQVTVMANDGTHTALQTFTFTVNDTAPSIPAVPAQTASHSATPFAVQSQRRLHRNRTAELHGKRDRRQYAIRCEAAIWPDQPGHHGRL